MWRNLMRNGYIKQAYILNMYSMCNGAAAAKTALKGGWKQKTAVGVISI